MHILWERKRERESANELNRDNRFIAHRMLRRPAIKGNWLLSFFFLSLPLLYFYCEMLYERLVHLKFVVSLPLFFLWPLWCLYLFVCSEKEMKMCVAVGVCVWQYYNLRNFNDTLLIWETFGVHLMSKYLTNCVKLACLPDIIFLGRRVPPPPPLLYLVYASLV